MARAQACDWKRLNWALPNKLLAEQTGIHHKTISKWRKRLRQPRSEAPTRKLKGFVDWSKPNRELARIHGVSKDYISNLRKRWGVEQSSPDSNAHQPMRTRDWSSVDWSLSNARIARAMRCSINTARRARMKFGRPNAWTRKPDLTYHQWLRERRRPKQT